MIGMMNTNTNTRANGHMNFHPRQSAWCLLTRTWSAGVCNGAATLAAA
jgi:hypothetical protein